MRIPHFRDQQPTTNDRAMTPMIDVVFLLLIFFVCASVGQVRELFLSTNLSAGTVESPDFTETEPWVTEIWLRLSRDGDNKQTIIELNERVYDKPNELKGTLMQLAKLGPESPVILDIAPDVPVGAMIQIYDLCREADFQSISFATQSDSNLKKPVSDR